MAQPIPYVDESWKAARKAEKSVTEHSRANPGRRASLVFKGVKYASWSEVVVAIVLTTLGIPFEANVEENIGGSKHTFDFKLPGKVYIEVDGEGHFDTRFGQNALNTRMQKDYEKDQWMADGRMLRIHFRQRKPRSAYRIVAKFINVAYEQDAPLGVYATDRLYRRGYHNLC